METVQQNENAVRRCVEIFNQRTTEFVDACFAENAEWIELPTAGRPAGRQGNRAFLREQQKQLLSLFPDRQLTIRNLVAQGDQVVLEQDWSGTAAMDLGSVKAGSKVRLQIASFFKLVDGLIVKQTDYCISIRNEAANQ